MQEELKNRTFQRHYVESKITPAMLSTCKLGLSAKFETINHRLNSNMGFIVN